MRASVWRMPNLELTYPRPDIAVLTLNRPEKLNALSHELVEDLHTTLDAIRANNDCRVVVLTGTGRGFCSGLDLTDPNPDDAGGGTEFPRSGMRWQERIADLTAKIHRLRQPVIAAALAPWSAPWTNHTVSITARPRSAPTTMAMCGVLRVPCVIDSARGK